MMPYVSVPVFDKICVLRNLWIETPKRPLDGTLVIERNQSNQTKLRFQAASFLWLLRASTARALFSVALEAPCDYPLHSQCASCGGVSYNLGRNFKAPKKLDTAQWRKVAYLIQHGFYFQKIRPSKNSYYSVPYPSTLAEARVFVKKYKKYALI
tara:strand:+ start:101 stop:562 length:462 start_codon:yes stop_codon:yes gene_type:complete